MLNIKAELAVEADFYDMSLECVGSEDFRMNYPYQIPWKVGYFYIHLQYKSRLSS